MPLSALALVLAAALLHAAWNVLLGGARDIRAATAVTLGLSVLLFAPVAAATWSVEAEAAPWIAASAGLELLYFVLLTTAYGRSDVSLVYPVARGVAPVLVLVASLAAGVALAGWQVLGVLLVGAGVLVMRGVRDPVDPRGVALGLAIAATIAGYTLVDDRGIEHASPVAYLELVLVPVAAAVLLPHLSPQGRQSLRGAIGARTLVAAACSFAAYALVLGALSLAPAAPVAAVRETSILFAVALAAVALREPVGVARVSGAALLLSGVVLVAVE